YVSYMPSIKLTHAEPIKVATSASDQFGIDPDRVAEAWEPGCKVLILNFPTNPTGGVTEKAKLEKLAKFAVEKDLLVISDEIYSELTFDGEHTSIASLPGMQDRTIFLHGFSKAFAMTGFRIGYACGPQPLIEAMMKIHQYSMLCAPILSQEAAIEALKNGGPAVAKMKEAYQGRRDLIVRRFNEMGLECHLPKGSFYAFPSIQSSGMSSIDFCKGLLDDQEVAIVPGKAFGDSGAGFARASFSTSYDRILEATNRIERYVDKIRK
ncbi:MAG: pyridoxal phosphate-dependent aminotransferase, partial [Coraliomargarita sp.]